MNALVLLATILFTGGQYSESTVHGWKVHLSTVLKADTKLSHETDSSLAYELGKIEQALPAHALEKIKQVEIWVELKSKNNVPIQYHTSADWLRESGDNPEKAKDIEFQAMDYATQDHDSLPLLWYFATAYEHRELGFNNPQVTAAFAHAEHIEDYSSSGTFPFNDANIYFVALSTAYFGAYSNEPYNRTRLKKIDPRGYEMVEKAWNVK